MENLKHGTMGGYNVGCRCAHCKLEAQLYRQRRKAKFAGQIATAPPTKPVAEVLEEPKKPRLRRHGTTHMYNLGCRCANCEIARWEYLDRQRAEVKKNPEMIAREREEIERLLTLYRANPAKAVQDPKFMKAWTAGKIKLCRYSRRRLARGRERRSRRV